MDALQQRLHMLRIRGKSPNQRARDAVYGGPPVATTSSNFTILGQTVVSPATTVSRPAESRQTVTPPYTVAISSPQSTVRSGPLWARAMAQVKDTKEWCLYERLLREGTSFAVLQPGNLEDVKQILSQIQKQLQDSRGRFQALGEITRKIATTLRTIADVGSGIAALNPYASMAWSGVQFIIQVALKHHDIKNMCWDELPRVIYLVGQYQTLEEIYEQLPGAFKTRSHLEKALVDMYASLIRFQVEVVIMCGSKMAAFWELLKGSETKIEERLTAVKFRERSLELVLRIVDRDVAEGQFRQVATGIESIRNNIGDMQSLLVQSTANISQVSIMLQENRRNEILSWLSPFPYENSHRSPENTASEGTGGWLLSNPAFQSWLTTRQVSTLWLRGGMGAGKSCLTHLVIEKAKMLLSPNRNERLAYFYCDGTDAVGKDVISDARKILGCILKQLALSNRSDSLYHEVVNCWREDNLKASLTARKAADIMCTIANESSKVVLIIDGFDECPLSTQRQLADCFKELLQQAVCPIQLFISGRPQVEQLMRSLHAVEIDIQGQNTDDIAYVIHERAEGAAKHSHTRHLYSSPTAASQTQDVIHTLISYAQGMFRWVSIAFNYLHASPSYAAMAWRIRELPTLKDLFDLYDVVWAEMTEKLSPHESLAVNILLLFMMYGLEPPTKPSLPQGGDHVTMAVSFATGGSAKDCLSLSDLVQLCPNFIECKRASLASRSSDVRFQHFSAGEYLVKRHGEIFSEKHANAYLAHLCVQAMLRNRWGGPFGDYSAVYWGDHLMKLKHAASAPLDHVLGDYKPLQDAVEAFLGGPDASSSFLQWSKSTDSSKEAQRVYYASKWIGTPLSPVFARRALGLSVQGLSDKARAATQLRPKDTVSTADLSAAYKKGPDAVCRPRMSGYTDDFWEENTSTAAPRRQGFHESPPPSTWFTTTHN